MELQNRWFASLLNWQPCLCTRITVDILFSCVFFALVTFCPLLFFVVCLYNVQYAQVDKSAQNTLNILNSHWYYDVGHHE